MIRQSDLSEASHHFRPWEGAEYRSRGLHGRRLLIVGESHYDWGEGQDRPTLTQEIVESYASGCLNHQFWNRVTRLCMAGVTLTERRNFWDAVAYYIYVQRMLKKGHRPTKADWRLSTPLFHETLAQLRPDYLLILGKQMWLSMPAGEDSDALQSIQRPARLYSIPNRRKGLATYVNHPRSHGFSVDRWSQVVEALLSAPLAAA